MSAVDDVLEHHGVKGMKWGVRKDPGHEGQRTKTKKIAKLDKKWEKRAKHPYALLMVHGRAAELYNKLDCDQINDRPEFKGKDFSDYNSPESKAYAKVHTDAMIARLKQAADEGGVNPSGTKKLGIKVNEVKLGEQVGVRWDLVIEDVEHAATDSNVVAVLVATRDDKGFITSMKVIPPEAEHSTFDSPGDFLEHYGVKGMKWGVRKKRGSVRPGKSAPKAHDPLKDMSDEDLKKVIARMELEKKYRDLKNPPKHNQPKSKGKKLVDDVLTQSGKNVGTTLVTGALGLALAGALNKKGVSPDKVRALTKQG